LIYFYLYIRKDLFIILHWRLNFQCRAQKRGRVKDNYRKKSATYGTARSQRRTLKTRQGLPYGPLAVSLLLPNDLFGSDPMRSRQPAKSFPIRFALVSSESSPGSRHSVSWLLGSFTISFDLGPTLNADW